MDYWGSVLGGLIITFLLTRLGLYVLNRLNVDKKLAPAIAAGSVFLLCLLIYNGPPGMAFFIYLPPIVFWLIYDLYKLGKDKKVSISDKNNKETI